MNQPGGVPVYLAGAQRNNPRRRLWEERCG